MIVKKLRMRVLSPYFYYTRGGLYADTSPFIGDIALSYGIGYSLGLIDRFPVEDNRINDLRKLPFLVTVGYPVKIGWKRIISVASVFKNSLSMYKEVFTLSEKKGGSIPYKNVRRIRPIDVGSEFYSYYFSREFDISYKNFAVRIGDGKDGVIGISVEEPASEDYLLINAYTLRAKNLFSEDLIKRAKRISIYNPFYIIIEGFKLSGFIDYLNEKGF